MKKIYLICLAIATSFTLVTAQYRLSSSSNAFVDGGSHDFVFTNITSEGAAGANVIWNFTGLQATNATLTTKMSAASVSDKSTLIPGANIVIEEAGSLFFFKVTSKGMEQYGTSNSCMVTRFDKPIVKLKFPFKYSDKVSGEYSGVTISQNTESKVSGTYEVVADAYGTLLLPGNVTIENALRIKQTRTFNNVDQKEITYRWYAVGVRYPLLVVIKYESATQSAVSQIAMYSHLSNLNSPIRISSIGNSLLSQSDVQVYPNPYKDQLNVKYKLEKSCTVKIDLIDANGKLLKNLLNQMQDKGNNKNCFVLGDKIKLGTFYIRLTAGDKSVTKTLMKN